MRSSQADLHNAHILSVSEMQMNLNALVLLLIGHSQHCFEEANYA